MSVSVDAADARGLTARNAGLANAFTSALAFAFARGALVLYALAILILAFPGLLFAQSNSIEQVTVAKGSSGNTIVRFQLRSPPANPPASFAIASITAIGYAGILLGPAGIGFVAEHFSLEASFVLMALGLLFVAVSGPKATRG